MLATIGVALYNRPIKTKSQKKARSIQCSLPGAAAVISSVMKVAGS